MTVLLMTGPLMTVLCAALAAITVLLAVPPAPGRSLDRRLARVDVELGLGQQRPRWWLPSKPMMSPSSAKPAATDAPLRRFHPSRNWW